jgi:hypothetical protein
MVVETLPQKKKVIPINYVKNSLTTIEGFVP